MFVLLVEDEDVKARCITRVLEHSLAVVEVHRATNLEDGLEMLQARPDIVVSDWNFPRELGAGVEPSGEVMVHACGVDGVPVVVVSGNDAPAGFVGHWMEPGDWARGLVQFLADHVVVAPRRSA